MTDAEFIDACFRRFLRRPAEPEGLAYYLERLRSGADRLDVVQGIVVSDEFHELLMRQAFGRHVGNARCSPSRRRGTTTRRSRRRDDRIRSRGRTVRPRTRERSPAST